MDPRSPKYRLASTPPIVLTDEIVKQQFRDFTPLMKDGPFPTYGKVIGFTRYDDPQYGRPLGAIVVNTITDNRFLYGIKLQTGEKYHVGPAPRRQ